MGSRLGESGYGKRSRKRGSRKTACRVWNSLPPTDSRAVAPAGDDRGTPMKREGQTKVNVAEQQDQFECWLAEMEHALERFFMTLEPEVRSKLDYSDESL